MNPLSVTQSTHEKQIKTSNNRIPDIRIQAELRRMWAEGVGFRSTGDRDRFIDLFRKGVAA